MIGAIKITITTILFGLPGGQRTQQTSVTLPSATTTVHDLIAHKVNQEVAEYAAHQRPGLCGEYLSPEVLIRAGDPKALAPGTAHEERARAEHAFAAREYMIVINDQRIEFFRWTVLSPHDQCSYRLGPLSGRRRANW